MLNYTPRLILILLIACLYIIEPTQIFYGDQNPFGGMYWVYVFGAFSLSCFMIGGIIGKIAALTFGSAAFILLVSHGLLLYFSPSSSVVLASAMAAYYLCNMEKLAGCYVYFLGLLIAAQAILMVPESNYIGAWAGFIFIFAEIMRRKHDRDVREDIGIEIYLPIYQREKALSEAANDDIIGAPPNNKAKEEPAKPVRQKPDLYLVK